MAQTRVASSATRNGVIAGVILGILSLPVITLTAEQRLLGVGGGLRILFVIVALVVCAVAGFAATRRNGLIRSGAWAGFLGGLITAFIIICLGIVILTLLAPYALLAGGAARRAGRLAALAGRLVILRLIGGGLLVALVGLIAGLLGGALGRIGRPRLGDRPAAPYTGAPAGAPGFAPPQGYAPPPPPQQDFASAAAYPTTPPSAASMPQPYFPPSAPTTPYSPYDNDAPTTIREPQE